MSGSPAISFITTCKGRLQHLMQSLAGMAAQPGTETIEKCLYNAGARRKTNQRNKSFLVMFDGEGNIVVTEAQAQA